MAIAPSPERVAELNRCLRNDVAQRRRTQEEADAFASGYACAIEDACGVSAGVGIYNGMMDGLRED